MPEQIRPECLVHCTLTKRERVGWGGVGGLWVREMRVRRRVSM